MAKRVYRYEVSQKHTSLGQIERALGLLGFRVTKTDADDPDDGSPGPAQYRVYFEQGRTMDHKVQSDAVVDQIMGLREGVEDAEA